MSEIANALMGRSVAETMVTGDVPPVEAGGVGFANYRRLVKSQGDSEVEKERKRKYRRQIVTATAVRAGIHEDATDEFDVDSSLFPSDAEKVAVYGAESDPVGAGSKVSVDTENDQAAPRGEPLLSPLVALVAPDATPDAYVPLDPILVPEAEKGLPPAQAVAPVTSPAAASPALNTVLAKPPAPMPSPVQPQPFPTQPQAPSASEPPVMSAESLNRLLPGAADSALFQPQPGTQMPDHKPGSGRQVMEALRRFTR